MCHDDTVIPITQVRTNKSVKFAKVKLVKEPELLTECQVS